MEIKFKKAENTRPVYDFAVKQEWEQYVYYECPAKLTEAEQKAMEKIARATFWALDCRDVARVDMRMDAEGRIYVLEVNPLPGLTPDYSDLVLIAKACGMEYDQLIAEIMTGGLRRLREKRREERELEREREAQRTGEKRDRDDKRGERADRDDKRERADDKRAADSKRRLEAKAGNGNGNSSNGSSSEPPAAPVRVKRERSEPTVAAERERAKSDPETTRERAKSEPDATRERAKSEPDATRERAKNEPDATRERAKSEPGEPTITN